METRSQSQRISEGGDEGNNSEIFTEFFLKFYYQKCKRIKKKFKRIHKKWSEG